ncbi:MAG TPA: phosphoribosylanthranilate isomerase [Bryobacteraceae bacterium]|nr:phosphoribosylanthranilate isomerase [Bryobacteraceae bacterium]
MMVKICGITNREDALAAVDAGASALGFNFHPKSPRYISPAAAAEIGAGLSIIKVGVFVNDPGTESIADQAGLDIVQLHGEETPGEIPTHLRVWKAFKVTPQWEAAMMNGFAVEAFLLDGPVPGEGVPFDWTRASGMSKIILAGGLGSDNVAEAIRQARPWGVDACSRLERAPGLKDHEKMRRFVRAAMDTL